MKGFMMSVEIAEKFFQRCVDREATTVEERMKIMNELLHEEKIRIVKENQIKDICNGKKVLFVDSKGRKKNV